MKTKTTIVVVIAMLVTVIAGMPVLGNADPYRYVGYDADYLEQVDDGDDGKANYQVTKAVVVNQRMFVSIKAARAAAKAAKVDQCLGVFVDYNSDKKITNEVCQCSDVCMDVQEILDEEQDEMGHGTAMKCNMITSVCKAMK